MAATTDLRPVAERRGGSSPSTGTTQKQKILLIKVKVQGLSPANTGT